MRGRPVLGVAMPAAPSSRWQYRFEDVPGITSESNRVEEVGMRARAAGKLYTGVIRIQEFIPPEGEVSTSLRARRGKIIGTRPRAVGAARLHMTTTKWLPGSPPSGSARAPSRMQVSTCVTAARLYVCSSPP